MDEKQTTQRRRDDVKKTKKLVSLNPDAVEKIKQFADENNTSFSAAIESLALVGMGEDTMLAYLPILSSQIHRSMSSGFNRIAKLAAFAAIEAGQTKEITKTILLQDLGNEWRENGAEFETELDIPKNHVVRPIHSQLVNGARVRTLVKLRKPIEELEDILRAEDVVEDE